MRFYWLVEEALAGCSLPGGHEDGHSSPHPPGETETLDSDLRWLSDHGVGAILSLTENPLSAGPLQTHGMESLHLAVPDMQAPLPEQFGRALAFIDRQRSLGRVVAVHCLMGQGRTAVILAAYLIRAGMPAARAIEELRAICPGAIAAPVQEHALEAFAWRRDWIL